MASTGVFKIYLLILVFFNFFAGGFNLTNSEDSFEIEKYLFITKIRTNLESNDDTFSSILRVVLAPFILLDALIFMLVVIGLGITVLPPIVEIILFTPMAIFIVFDYLIPAVRGN